MTLNCPCPSANLAFYFKRQLMFQGRHSITSNVTMGDIAWECAFTHVMGGGSASVVCSFLVNLLPQTSHSECHRMLLPRMKWTICWNCSTTIGPTIGIETLSLSSASTVHCNGNTLLWCPRSEWSSSEVDY